MAEIKITDLVLGTVIATGDVFPYVDISDVTQAPSGSTKKVTIDTLEAYLNSNLTFLTSYTETDPIFTASAAGGIVVGDITNWNNAFGWGDHSTAGYLTSFTETDPIFIAHTVSDIIDGTGFLKNTAGVWSYDNSTYLTSFTETDPVFTASAASNVVDNLSSSVFLAGDGTYQTIAPSSDGAGVYQVVITNAEIIAAAGGDVTINHNLGSTNIVAEMWDATTNERLFSTLDNRTANTMTTRFSSTPAGDVDVIVVGGASFAGTAGVITAKDEGVDLTTSMSSIDFVGAGVEATKIGDAVTVTVAGGGGGNGIYGGSGSLSGATTVTQGNNVLRFINTVASGVVFESNNPINQTLYKNIVGGNVVQSYNILNSALTEYTFAQAGGRAEVNTAASEEGSFLIQLSKAGVFNSSGYHKFRVDGLTEFPTSVNGGIYRDSGGNTDGMRWSMNLNNSVGVIENYAAIGVEIIDNTNGSEDGVLKFYSRTSGTNFNGTNYGMVLSGTGLKIGTGSASAKLHVGGDTRVDGALTINTTTPSVVGQVWQATGVAGQGAWTTAVNTNFAENNLTFTADRFHNLAGNDLWLSDGFVKIGNPTSDFWRLRVQSVAGVGSAIFESEVNGRCVVFSDGTTNNAANDAISVNIVGGTTPRNRIGSFSNHNLGTASNMQLLTSGLSVGATDFNALAKLHVGGDTRIDGDLDITGYSKLTMSAAGAAFQLGTLADATSHLTIKSNGTLSNTLRVVDSSSVDVFKIGFQGNTFGTFTDISKFQWGSPASTSAQLSMKFRSANTYGIYTEGSGGALSLITSHLGLVGIGATPTTGNALTVGGDTQIDGNTVLEGFVTMGRTTIDPSVHLSIKDSTGSQTFLKLQASDNSFPMVFRANKTLQINTSHTGGQTNIGFGRNLEANTALSVAPDSGVNQIALKIYDNAGVNKVKIGEGAASFNVFYMDLPEYTDDAAAGTAGLTKGMLYVETTSGDRRVLSKAL